MLRRNASIPEMREAIAELQSLVRAMQTGEASAVAAPGGEGHATRLGRSRTPARGIDWIRRGIVTERRAESPGVFADPATPGLNVQYKVRAIDGGFETDWHTPLRFFDHGTLGYVPAAVDDPALIVQFPAGDGTFTPRLIVWEQLKGRTCT